MTDNSQNFDSLQEKNQQVLDNISQLQIQEKKLYDSLDDVTLSSDQKQQIINKINEISQMRMNMYASMKDMYSYYQKNVSSSRTTLGQSIAAVDVLENELNQAKRRLNLLEDQKNNKLRLVEINTYYGKRYNAHTKLMKTIVIFCIPVIILAVLKNKGILPPNIYGLLSGIIIIIAVVLIILQLIDISNRDTMNWDEYNWYFDKESAPALSSEVSTTTSDPWASSSSTSMCVGSACCYEGSVYDDVKNICVPTVVYNQDHPESTETSGTTTTSGTSGTSGTTDTTTNTSGTTTTESFKGLEKYAYIQNKPISFNNNIMPMFASLSKF